MRGNPKQIGRKYILTKNELIKTVSDNTGMTQKVAEEAIGAALNVIANELECGGNVQILGFGAFEVKERAARTGRNPHTGGTMEMANAGIKSTQIQRYGIGHPRSR